MTADAVGSCVMKILIFGATGGVGSELVTQALAAGHELTVLVRDAAKIAAAPRVKLIVGDATDRRAIEQAVTGVDAVVSSLGTGNRLRGDVVSRATEILIPAMQSAGVRRLIVVSAFGVGEQRAESGLIQRLIFATFLRSLYADKDKADTMLRQSTLDWTLVHPVRLTNGPHTTTYQAIDHAQMRGMPSISRADVAHFMLAQLSSDAWLRRSAILT